jgi:N-acetyl-alpha-D-muramate 1-phosphate uridylyltransferase
MYQPKTAMVLAAGLATRLRPLSLQRPKALVEVAGKTLLDHTLDRLAEVGVTRAVVNTHHLGDQIEAHLAGRAKPEIQISREDPILDTGGGIAHALPLLGPDPFYVINAKIVWRGGQDEALKRLAAMWDDARMDALLLLQPTVTAVGYEGPGDLAMDQFGRLRFREESEIAPFVYASIQIIHPRLFDGAPGGAFPLRPLWERAAAAGRLFGLRHDGEWYHVSTPQGLAAAEERLRRAHHAHAEGHARPEV